LFFFVKFCIITEIKVIAYNKRLDCVAKTRGNLVEVAKVLTVGRSTDLVHEPKAPFQGLCCREGDELGRHLDRTQVYRIVANAALRAGIQGKVSPHWLRHAHASHSIERGAPIHLVQQTLGHASVATTSRYLHARPNDSSSLYLS